jgi:hypothetical protein
MNQVEGRSSCSTWQSSEIRFCGQSVLLGTNVLFGHRLLYLRHSALSLRFLGVRVYISPGYSYGLPSIKASSIPSELPLIAAPNLTIRLQDATNDHTFIGVLYLIASRTRTQYTARALKAAARMNRLNHR